MASAPAVNGTWSVASVAGQLVGGVSSGVGGAAQEVGEQFELGVGVAGAELVHRGVHPRVQADQLGAAVAQRADDDGAAVVRVALAGDPAAAFEPVEDAGHGGGVQPGASGQGAGAERAVAVDELQAVQVDVFEVSVGADVVVEQRQLHAQLAQRLFDGVDGAPSAPLSVWSPCLRHVHMIWSPYLLDYGRQCSRGRGPRPDESFAMFIAYVTVSGLLTAYLAFSVAAGLRPLSPGSHRHGQGGRAAIVAAHAGHL